MVMRTDMQLTQRQRHLLCAHVHMRVVRFRTFLFHPSQFYMSLFCAAKWPHELPSTSLARRAASLARLQYI